MNREISFKETVELFINTIIYDIVNEVEIPRINFIFNENAYDLFYEVMKKPFKLKKGWTPDIKEEDIFFLKNIIDYNYPSIFIKDHIKFFSLLTNITNNLIKSYNKHNQNKISRSLLMNIMRRIWLRMGVDDFNNVEMFLEKQLEFVKTDFFEEYNFNVNKTHTIDTFHNYKVKIFNSLNNTWDESNKCISFLITNNEENHELPNIYYDIINKTCYIYAVQNSRNAHKSLIINKMIYKEYRGSCQPNKVYALKLFIKLLKEKEIKNIKIPTLQVLNYHYHELLSIKEKENFPEKWNKEIEKLTNEELYYYYIDKNWYNHIVDKEDKISKLKTEDFINLIYKIIDEDNDLYLTNDIDISDTLDIKIKSLKQDN